MGVYVRKDSPFYWMLLERQGGKRLVQSTKVPIAGSSAYVEKQLRQTANDVYAMRMAEMAAERLSSIALRSRLPLPEAVDEPGKLPAYLPTADGWGYVYFIRRHDHVKIGTATDVGARLKTLQTASAEPLTLIAAVLAHKRLELALHKRFSHLRTRGEWFALSEELSEYIAGVAGGRNPLL